VEEAMDLSKDRLRNDAVEGKGLTADFFPEISVKHMNALCGKNVKLLSVTAGGTYSNHWAL
jgi:hypothetical protein